MPDEQNPQGGNPDNVDNQVVDNFLRLKEEEIGDNELVEVMTNNFKKKIEDIMTYHNVKDIPNGFNSVEGKSLVHPKGGGTIKFRETLEFPEVQKGLNIFLKTHPEVMSTEIKNQIKSVILAEAARLNEKKRNAAAVLATSSAPVTTPANTAEPSSTTPDTTPGIPTTDTSVPPLTWRQKIKNWFTNPADTTKNIANHVKEHFTYSIIDDIADTRKKNMEQWLENSTKKAKRIEEKIKRESEEKKISDEIAKNNKIVADYAQKKKEERRQSIRWVTDNTIVKPAKFISSVPRAIVNNIIVKPISLATDLFIVKPFHVVKSISDVMINPGSDKFWMYDQNPKKK